jgi:TP901 family phage tail tape measure protein
MGRAFVEIGADPAKLFKALQQANARIGRFAAGMRSVGTRMMGAGVAMAAPLALASRQFATFDDAIRATAAVSGATGAGLQSLTDRARLLGESTSFTAVQVANLMTELGRAGFSPDEINAMTGAVLDLARATGTDATLASGIMAATLRQFALGATDAARVSDVLTTAANATFNTVEGLGESLKYAGPVAKSLGMSLEDTVAVLGVLGNVGIQGSEAGTALRRLSVIAAGAGEELQQIFGVSNTDAAGQMKPLVQVLDEINTVTANMPVAERTAKMAKAFGLLGITSANVLSQSAGGVTQLADKLRVAEGTAARTAKEMDAGLGGSARIALSALEGMQISIGEALAPTLQALLGTITEVIGGITRFVKDNQAMVVSIAQGVAIVIGAGAALYGLGAAIGAVSATIGIMLNLWVAIPVLIGAAVGAVLSFTGVLDGLGAIFSTTFSGMYDAIATGDLAGAMDILWLGLQAGWLRGVANFMSTFEPWIDFLGNTFSYLSANVLTVWDGMVNGMMAAWDMLESTIRQGWNYVQSFFTKGFDLNAENQKVTDEMSARARQRELSTPDRVAEADAAAAARLGTRSADAYNAAAADAEGQLASRARGANQVKVLGKQAAELLADIEKATTLDQLRDYYGQFEALNSSGSVAPGQATAIEDALADAQNRIMASSRPAGDGGGIAAGGAAGGVGQSQAEVAGTFSAAAVGGMGVGSSLAQKQVDLLSDIADNTAAMIDGSIVKE